MSKRKLNRDELKASEIGLKRQEKAFSDLETKLKIIDFKLDIEIEHNFKTEKERWEKMKKQIFAEKFATEEIIKNLKDQIENGVKIKEAE